MKSAREHLDAWNDITGFVAKGTSYYGELIAVIEEAMDDALEEAAKKLDASSDHHAETDKHPAFDRTRSGDEPCEEHGHVYHSYPGYAAHVVSAMAEVIRSLKSQPPSEGEN